MLSTIPDINPLWTRRTSTRPQVREVIRHLLRRGAATVDHHDGQDHASVIDLNLTAMFTKDVVPRKSGGLGAVADTQLGVQGAQMSLDRVLADVELTAKFAVVMPVDNRDSSSLSRSVRPISRPGQLRASSSCACCVLWVSTTRSPFAAALMPAMICSRRVALEMKPRAPARVACSTASGRSEKLKTTITPLLGSALRTALAPRARRARHRCRAA